MNKDAQMLIVLLAIGAGAWWVYRSTGGNIANLQYADLLMQDNPAAEGIRDFFAAGGKGEVTTFYGTNVPILVF
jgi:hypothetical protein